MRNFLIATSALAFAGGMATGPASAADMMSVGVGGYMQQWFGYANRDDDGAEGGWAVHSDSEIFFKGSLESDMGLKYTVHVELEGDGGETAMDESYVRVSGEFGQIEFGSRDHAMVRMHAGISDVGIGLTSGDTQAWIPGTYLETAGHAGTAGGGNDPKLNYISPRVSGLQVGLSYAPDDGSSRTTTPDGNDDATWGAGVNFQQEVGDMAVTVSLGHRSVDSAGAKVEFMSAAAPAAGATDKRLTQAQHAAHKTAWERWEYLASTDEKNKEKMLAGADAATRATALAGIVNDGLMGREAITGATSSMTKGDAATYTNAGVGIGFGAFKFNVAYATSDGGAYKAMATPVKMSAAELTAYAGGISTASVVDGKIIDTAHMFDHDMDPETDKVAEREADDSSDPAVTELNDPANETWMASTVVEDKSKNFDVWGVSATYTDGPMALSLGYMTHEDDAGGEREATMFSASYTLGPGVAWKSSVFMVEDTTSHANVTDGMNEGTGFVTGVTLSF